MHQIQQNSLELLKCLDALKIQGRKPVHLFYKFKIYKLKTEDDSSDDIFSELAYVAISENQKEKCLIRCMVFDLDTILEIKVFRSVYFDRQICFFLVQDFVENFLREKYSI